MDAAKTVSATFALSGQAPVNTARPTISGNATKGGTLTCSTGTWTGSPTAYTFTWLRDGTSVAGGQSYKVKQPDRGHSFTCNVTATNAFGNGTASSAAVTVS